MTSRRMQKGKRLGQWLGAAVLFTLPWLAHAEVALTPALIEKWIAAAPQIEAFGKKYESKLDQMSSSSKDFSKVFDPDTMLKPIREAGLLEELESMADDAGFASAEEWAEVTGKIAKAAAAIKMQGYADKMGPEMEARMKAMMDNPDLTPEARQMMQQTMAQSMGMVKSLKDVPESEKKMVAPYLPKMDFFFKDKDGKGAGQP
ncbi:MAG: hypothetical protein IPM37_19910 [Hahellaceae bacterium]|jgi:hypothetical protein|nr:hypothetical protein [Hahellaceae bacterium]